MRPSLCFLHFLRPSDYFVPFLDTKEGNSIPEDPRREKSVVYKVGKEIITKVCMYVYLLITLTCSPKAELRRVQLNGISRMHVNASGCCQTVMNDPRAQQPSQMFFMFFDSGKGQTTTPRTPCPSVCMYI